MDERTRAWRKEHGWVWSRRDRKREENCVVCSYGGLEVEGVSVVLGYPSGTTREEGIVVTLRRVQEAILSIFLGPCYALCTNTPGTTRSRTVSVGTVGLPQRRRDEQRGDNRGRTTTNKWVRWLLFRGASPCLSLSRSCSVRVALCRCRFLLASGHTCLAFTRPTKH